MPPVKPSIIYHYTNAEALISIVTSSKLRASDAEFLNDAQEMQFGRDRLQRELIDTADTIRKDNEARAHFMLGAEKGLNSGLSFFPRNLRSTTFVACFCGNGDLLSQWRGYGAGNGVAIGFSRKALQSQCDSTTRLVEVRYGDAAIDQMISEVLPGFGSTASKDSGAEEGEDDDLFARASNAGYFATASQLYPALAGIKHEAFSEEREWRLLKMAKTEDEKYRVGAHGIAPYISLEFKKSAISEIVVGPGPHSKLRVRGVERLMKNSGALFVEVKPSSAPFRG
jgi:Protein of unknown function (DUF2971)